MDQDARMGYSCSFAQRISNPSGFRPVCLSIKHAGTQLRRCQPVMQWARPGSAAGERASRVGIDLADLDVGDDIGEILEARVVTVAAVDVVARLVQVADQGV